MRQLVDGVDHVFIPMVDAAAAFAALTEQLELPALWPFTSFGGFASGGVSVGSIKLEIIDSTTEVPFSTAQDPPEIQGVAFRPSTPVDDAYLAEVDARSLRRSAPSGFEVDGELRWTNLYLPDLISDTAGPFVCDYHVPGPRDLVTRRQALEDCGGGRLGVLDASELVIQTRDTEAGSRRWQRLLDPLEPTQLLVWHPTVGPAIRLVEGPGERVDHLQLRVRSRERASRLWQQLADGPLGRLPLQFVD